MIKTQAMLKPPTAQRSRWYDAALGRFVSADSLVPSAGNPQAFNRYAYVGNNPINSVDPSGNFMTEDEGGDKLGCDMKKYPQYCYRAPTGISKTGVEAGSTSSSPPAIDVGYVGSLLEDTQDYLVEHEADPDMIAQVNLAVEPLISIGCWLNPKAAAVTFGNNVTFCKRKYYFENTIDGAAPGVLPPNGINGYLVHELVHVRQFRDEGWEPFWASVADSWNEWTDPNYDRYRDDDFEVEGNSCSIAYNNDSSINFDVGPVC